MGKDNVNIRELKQIIARLLEHIENIYGTEIQLEEDYYWHIDQHELYHVTKGKHELEPDIGSLYEDWEFL